MNIFKLIYRIPEFIYRINIARKLKLRYLVYVQKPITLVGEERIKIGEGFAANAGVRLETYKSEYCQDTLRPLIVIGNNCMLNYRTHIGAINEVRIGNGVLMGSDVIIVDHNHGNSQCFEELFMRPATRPLHSKGSIIIGDNCWIGDKVCICGNVRIGTGTVIGCGAVVTHDIPDFSVVVGNPARVIRTFDKKEISE